DPRREEAGAPWLPDASPAPALIYQPYCQRSKRLTSVAVTSVCVPRVRPSFARALHPSPGTAPRSVPRATARRARAASPPSSRLPPRRPVPRPPPAHFAPAPHQSPEQLPRTPSEPLSSGFRRPFVPLRAKPRHGRKWLILQQLASSPEP